MAAGDLYPARRVPVPGPGQHLDEVIFHMEAGDYCGPIMGATGGKPAVWMMLPAEVPAAARGLRHVVSPPHVFTEQPDGSLEIRQSLGCERLPEGGYVWHGFLDAGNVWREV